MKNQFNLIAFFLLGTLISSCKKEVNYQPQINALQVSVSALQKRCDSLAASLTQSNTTVLNLSNEIVVLTTNQGNQKLSIDSVKAQITGMLTSLTQINTQLSVVYTQIAQLNTELTQANNNITAIDAQIAQLDTQVTQLTAQYAAVLAQLNAIIAQLSITPTSLSNGLVAYYPFDGNANDLSGNNDNGVVHGATLTSDRFGNANGAYSFNGSSDFISLPQPFFGGAVNSQFSISLWFKTNVLNTQTLWDKDGFWQGLSITLNSDGSILLHGTIPNPDEYQNAQTGANVIATNKWNNLIIIYNNTNCAMYVNGSPVNVIMNTLNSGGGLISNTMAGSVNLGETAGGNSNGINQFGCANSVSTGNTSFFSGIIDDYRLYNRTLTAAEIAYLATN